MNTFLPRFVTFALALTFLSAMAFLPTRVRADDAPKAEKETGKCMMWKVSSPTATVYLVGSMHLATREMYPLPKEMEEAFAKSDTLVVEININKLDPQKMLALVMDKGMYKGKETLSTSIDKDTWEKVKATCEKLGLPAIGVDKLKPWAVAMTIEELEIQKLGLDPKLGIDQHFLDLADAKKKTIEELESADFQIGMLAGFDAKLQEKNLAATLDDAKDMKDTLDKMVAAWKAGDDKGMNDLVADKQKTHPETDEVMQKMIYDRNGPMAEKVQGYLKGNKTVFVIAGAMHMVGDKGIVSLLRKKDFKVEQSPATKAAE